MASEGGSSTFSLQAQKTCCFRKLDWNPFHPLPNNPVRLMRLYSQWQWNKATWQERGGGGEGGAKQNPTRVLLSKCIMQRLPWQCPLHHLPHSGQNGKPIRHALPPNGFLPICKWMPLKTLRNQVSLIIITTISRDNRRGLRVSQTGSGKRIIVDTQAVRFPKQSWLFQLSSSGIDADPDWQFVCGCLFVI